MRRVTVLVAIIGAITAPAIGPAPRAQALAPVQWSEIAWPFPRDAWPAGKAFQCKEGGCEGQATLSVRVKLGFCNCGAGVRYDDEVDNVADVDMITPDFIPTGPGEAIKIGQYSGRIRSYEYSDVRGQTRVALGLALARNCDLIAVSVNGAKADETSLRELATQRLQSQDILKWINRQLGEK